MEQKTLPVFVISDAPVPWPVDVRLPAAGGEFVTQRFTALVKVRSEADYERLLATPAEADGAPAKTQKDVLDDNARLFPEFIAGWDDVRTPDGAPRPFTPDALTALVTGPHGPAISAGLWQAIAEVRHGVRLGNFAAPSAPG